MRFWAKTVCGVILVAVVAMAAFVTLFPLSTLARRLASTDQIIASTWGSPVRLSLTGEQARAVVEAVRSAKRDTRTYANIFDVKVRFLQGTNVLGEIDSSSRLFLVRGRQYRVESGVLERLLVTPVHQMAIQEREQRRLNE